ncbi:unnamed protein product [Clonostachys chloroleuca]|uniref:CBS domain-containing protein n=1 Tax=Clonostachys chloroleuca TaxID=1926264 RepID=A0AA35Q723_9HYPO|nr:unnamed protein product [Clonostachys chloroleuca]
MASGDQDEGTSASADSAVVSPAHDDWHGAGQPQAQAWEEPQARQSDQGGRAEALADAPGASSAPNVPDSPAEPVTTGPFAPPAQPKSDPRPGPPAAATAPLPGRQSQAQAQAAYTGLGGHERHLPLHDQHYHQQPSAIPHIVAPSSYLRLRPLTRSAMATTASQPAPPPPPPQQVVADKDEAQGLKNIRDFLKVRTGYDVFPLSFRLIVLDTDLLINKSLNIMIQNSIVSAPLWDSHTSRFAGLLTATDYMNVIQYYCQFPEEMSKLDQFRLSSLRDIEKAIGAVPIETISVNPLLPLYEACKGMLKTRARRIPLVDKDDETGKEWVVSVITQYRILKFIAVNNEHNTVLLKRTVRELNLGTYTNVATAQMTSPVLDVIQMMVHRNISCVPIIDKDNRLLNVFEAVDIIPCIKGGVYEELAGSVGDALLRRPEDSPGIYTCSEHDRLGAIFDTVRKSRVHRLVVVDDENKLKGIVSLSDILAYVLLSPVD